ncbi:Asp-tRNA(Asn)/Glu-tRNA(Gln) amidotransferase A subunit family amidase [Novosphingobium hassiacum]|uniref:Asp-tRNA(Asn)/Glu-tRNA(Gln) amidotransferase A subunit family amidase n=2 Tax=Novosphingobium hassiacum TaxID=173676 RepID=A0A7W5ZS57_9SPHN|nr:Asp-tRNA(Asn)/Glu-tRNA(Gln) amidotransferase A subunit family amidase [Novosphingobium hassiacum]
MMNRSPSFATAAYGTARHPFRASLPTHVLRELPKLEPEVIAAMRRAEERLREADIRSEPVDLKRITMQDLRDFLIAYCACFMAVMAFIA